LESHYLFGGFIETFLKKNANIISKGDFELFISRRIEENTNLDYKDIRIYSNFDEPSKHVSTFSNSADGLLIIGVSKETIGKGKNFKMYAR